MQNLFRSPLQFHFFSLDKCDRVKKIREMKLLWMIIWILVITSPNVCSSSETKSEFIPKGKVDLPRSWIIITNWIYNKLVENSNFQVKNKIENHIPIYLEIVQSHYFYPFSILSKIPPLWSKYVDTVFFNLLYMFSKS